jgi:hypothetical protein
MKEIEKLTAKEEFLQAFEKNYQDEFLPADWDDSKKKRVAFHTTSNKVKTSMFTSIPMSCTSSKCPFASTCPLEKEKIAPINMPCPIELSIVRNFMADYIDQLDVDPGNLVELSMIRDLVDQEVQYIRKTKLLSKESFIQENIVGLDSDGDPVLRKELHLAVELEDRLHKRRQQLFKQLLATREAKAKAGMAQLDSAQVVANLMTSFKELQYQKDELLKERLGIVDIDDYIEIDKE